MADVGFEALAVGEGTGGQEGDQRDPGDGIERQQDVRERAALVEQQRDRDDPGAHHDRAGGRRDRIQETVELARLRRASHQRGAVW